MIRVAIYRGNDPVRYTDIPQGTARIGRAPENDVVLEDATKGVSRVHAELRQENGRWVVVDLNSQNGVWIGDRRVMRQEIQPGTAISLGPYEIVLEEADTHLVSEDSDEATGMPHRQPRERGDGAPRYVPVLPLAAAAAVVLIGVAAFAWLQLSSQPSTPPQTTSETAVQPSSAEPPAAETELQRHLRVAAERIEAQDRDGAAGELDAALRLAPDNAEVKAQKAKFDSAFPPSAPPVTTDADADAGAATLPDWPARWPAPARRAQESTAAYRKRATDLKKQYQYGVALIERGELAAGITALEAADALEPGFHDISTQIQRARTAQQALQARDDGRRALAEARRLEQTGEVGQALTQYQRAAAVDPSLTEATTAAARLQDLIKTEAPKLQNLILHDRAFRKPKDAQARLEQLLKLLPVSDPARRDAEQQLRELRRGSGG